MPSPRKTPIKKRKGNYKPGPGRPSKESPKQRTTILLAESAIQWIEANQPRGVSVSAFAREALIEKIERGGPLQDPTPGRPEPAPLCRSMGVCLDPWILDWIAQNLPRRISVSAFVREAVQDKIEDEMRQPGK